MSTITPPFYWRLLDKDVVPDWLIRIGIRHFIGQRLRQQHTDSPWEARAKIVSLVEELRRSPIALSTNEANEQHYEVPSRFYEFVLGARRKYSCAYWPAGVNTLDEAETAMLALTVERACVNDGDEIMDLGCGWGALSLYLAERFPNSRILGVSNSRTQREFIVGEIARRGLKNLEIVTANIVTFQTDRRFDRILSVEMFEHMRNYDLLLGKISNWMKAEAKLFVHIFTHHRFAYPFAVEDSSDWMSAYFFTNGLMPSDDLLLYFQKQLQCSGHWLMSGVHYQRTAKAWLEKADRNREAVLVEFRNAYGEQALTMFVRWRVFFMAVEELWGWRAGKEWTVSHYVFERNADGKSLRSSADLP